ncbi:MAG: signal recognition particle-docking protein FtsY [Rhizobacter sp.]|nr:signal recognition particle-docking protein FtsY [Rhizobacter sp.]
MFSFFKKKPAVPEVPPAVAPADAPAISGDVDTGRIEAEPASDEPEKRGWLSKLRQGFENVISGVPVTEQVGVLAPPAEVPAPAPALPSPVAPTAYAPPSVTVPAVAPTPTPTPAPAPTPTPAPSPSPLPPISAPPAFAPAPAFVPAPAFAPAPTFVPAPAPPMPVERPAFGFEPLREVRPAFTEPPTFEPVPELAPEPERRGWMDRLRQGLRKTGTSIAQVFVATEIDEALYEELEEALLMADTGVKAAEFLLSDLRRRVKATRTTDPSAVKALLAEALTDLLKPLEKGLQVGLHTPTVMMVVGVNGAGKTTSIGKLTRHLADNDQKVLLAAADTFRAAAREQLAVWADRNQVEIVSQAGGDPSAVTFDAVSAGVARGSDVVIADTAGRLPTQIHLMEELKKIKRVIAKAMPSAPHEILLVVDGNTGQNALAQVRSFDDALGLTGLIITKLDGTAKGGVLAAIARERPVPVYFIGVGETLADLETFDAEEFAQALLGI